MDNERHDLLDFLTQVSAEIQAEYERIRRRAAEDPGTAGDQGEENWAKVLRGWLPPSYRVVTKGRLIGYTGVTSPQVDIIVLNPAYPPALVDKKLYLAAGVAAAFECKITLKRQHVENAVRTAVKLKSLVLPRSGTQHQEIHTPLIYGLLAHSHMWKSPESKPKEIIRQSLHVTDAEVCDHPRLQIDLICVADLTVWTQVSSPFVGPAKWGSGWERMTSILGADGSTTTSFKEHTEPNDAIAKGFNPIGLALMDITHRLSWEDRVCRTMAQYYKTVLSFAGQGMSRHWPPSIFSAPTRQIVTSPVAQSALLTGDFWDDFHAGLVG